MHLMPIWYRKPKPASRILASRPPHLSPKIRAIIHKPTNQTQRTKCRYDTRDPTLATPTVKVWIGLVRTRSTAGPTSAVWVNVQMDKNTCSVTVNTGFDHSGFVSCIWAFCHVLVAQEVTYQRFILPCALYLRNLIFLF